MRSRFDSFSSSVFTVYDAAGQTTASVQADKRVTYLYDVSVRRTGEAAA